MKKLKYFHEGRVESGYGQKGIILGSSIFSICINNESEISVTFMEECDGFFFVKFTKSDAVNLLKEAIDWIENNLPEEQKNNDIQNKKRRAGIGNRKSV